MNAQAWKGLVGQLKCVLCEHCGAEQRGCTYLHHCRMGQGLSERSSDHLVIALCHEHHQGAGGVHQLGPGGLYTRHKLDELDLLAMTIKAATYTI